MITFENECVGCPPEMGCLGSCCPYRYVPHLECDSCKDEVEELYDTDRGQLCEDCATDEEKEECDKIDSDNADKYQKPQYDEGEW